MRLLNSVFCAMLSTMALLVVFSTSASAVLLYENLMPQTTVGNGADEILMESLANPLDLGSGSSFDIAGLRDSNTDIGGVSTSGTLWLSFTIQSVTGTQPGNFAALQTYNNGSTGLGIGKAFNNHAFSSFGVGSDADLELADGSGFQLLNTDVYLVVVKTDFVAGGNDTATIWLNPNLDTDINSQTSNSRVGDLAFDQVRLRSGNSHSFIYDDIRYATTFSEAVAVPEPSAFLFGGLVCGVVGWMQVRKSRNRLA